MTTISLLPSEILNSVASLSQEQQQYRCLTVCHSWLSSFRPCLYQNVHISNRRQLKQFISSIQVNNQLGIYIKSLIFNSDIGISKDELQFFSFYLPNLEQLDFNPKLWKYQSSNRLVHDKKWTRMTKLPTLSHIQLAIPLMECYGQSLIELTLPCAIVKQLHTINNNLTQLFQLTPQLRRLRLYDKGENQFSAATAIRFNFTDLLELQSRLPLLEELELLDIALSTIWPSEIQSFRSCTKMHKLHIRGHLAHYQWISIIAQLYPNLLDLELNLSWDAVYKQTMTLVDYAAIENSIIYLAKECKLLKKLKLVSTGGSVIQGADQLFYETASKNGVKLQSIDGIMTSSQTNLKSLSSAILSCCDSENTTSLKLQLWRDLNSIENIMIPVSVKCQQQLKELVLNCGKFSYAWNYGYDLDVIFQYCPQLTKLNLTMGKMTVSRNKSCTTMTGIESITLNQVHFTTESMNLLSACCPNLKQFKISKCIKDRDQLEQKISLDLSNQHQLHTLVIDHLYLRPSQFIERSRIDSALFSINIKQKERRWYHVYNSRKNRTNTRQLKRLNDVQANQVQSYKMKEKDWDRLEETSIRGTYREFKYWESDIPYGYIYIATSNSIKNLLFNKVKLFA